MTLVPLLPETRMLNGDDDQREQLLSTALAAWRDHGDDGLIAFCDTHPTHAPWLRRQVEFLSELGLLQRGSCLAGMPRRLGDFDLLERIGGGGMGVVFRARQRSLGREVAIKIVRPEFLAIDHAHLRFAREIDAVAKLQHPSIVKVHAAGEEQGVPFLAMELLAGSTLAELGDALRARPVRSRRAADLTPGRDGDWPSACARLCADVAEAMQHAHARGVWHRDLKPSNVFLGADGAPVVIDFGLALGADDVRITQTLTALGSLPYCPPERVRGEAGQCPAREDVYSLGATLHELLTGEPPFGFGSVAELRERISSSEMIGVRRLNPDVGRDLAVVCETALAPVRRRYFSMAAFAADLRAVLAKQPIHARPPGPLERTVRWVRRRATLVLGAALAIVVIAGTPLALFVRERTRTAERAPLLATATADDLLARNDELWPTGPQWLQERRGYGAWLRDAKALLAERAAFMSVRDHLRTRAEHLPNGPPAQAQRAASLQAELASLRQDEAWIVTKMVYGKEAELLPLRARVARAEWELREELRYGFANDGDERQHTVLVRLLAKLQEVEARVPEVQGRVRQAEVIGRLERDAASAFASTAAAIADGNLNPQYRGLRLPPQAGLIALGQDRDSRLFEFAHLPSGRPAVRDVITGRLQVSEETGIVLVLLPGGTFRMGAAPEDPINRDPMAYALERPAHDVTLAAFFLSKFEMTQGQWLRLTGLNPSGSPVGGGGDVNPAPTTLLHPVECVSWIEAHAGLRRLGLHLPTEAQWEYAARSGSSDPYGGVAVAELALRENLEAMRPGTKAWALHAPVGSFVANAFGCFDMLGNVSEWCLDGDARYSEDPVSETGQRPCRPHCPRMVRGGHSAYTAASARVSLRAPMAQGTELAQVGIRPALQVDGAR